MNPSKSINKSNSTLGSGLQNKFTTFLRSLSNSFKKFLRGAEEVFSEKRKKKGKNRVQDHFQLTIIIGVFVCSDYTHLFYEELIKFIVDMRNYHSNQFNIENNA